jgi:5'-3' exonuclease
MKWADGYEADDILGSLAAQATEPVEVVTGDRDLFQLVDDSRGIRVAYIGKGVSRLELIDEAEVTRRYQIPGRSYAAFAALRGDPSDGLPGVPGVGEKTAAALVRSFGSVEAMLAAIDAGHGGFPPGSRAKVVAAREYLDACLPVVMVASDAPVKLSGGELPSTPADPARIAALDARWELGSSLGRVLSALAAAP